MSADNQEAVLEDRQESRDISQAQLAEQARDGNVEYLRNVLKSKLHPGVVRVLDNYLSPDFVLSNQNPENLIEFKWLLRIRLRRVFWMMPQEESNLTEDVRAIAYDDTDETLPHLSQEDRNIIWAYADGIWWRAKRSERGYQQEMIGRTTSVVERKNGDEDNGTRGIGGMF